MKTPVWLLMLLLVGLIFFLFFLNLVLGSVSIPFRAVWDICLWGDHENHIWTNIIWKSRMPQAVTALVAGAGLSVSGLQMQTVFRNPLAGPSVLGISREMPYSLRNTRRSFMIICVRFRKNMRRYIQHRMNFRCRPAQQQTAIFMC